MQRLYPLGIFLIIAVIGLSLLFYNRQNRTNGNRTHDSLLIVWTSGEPDVAKKMVFMYTDAAKRQAWYNSVTLLIWGPSQNIAVSDDELRGNIKTMRENGIRVIACKACAESYGLSRELEELGVEVFYTGEFLTEHLKLETGQVITF